MPELLACSLCRGKLLRQHDRLNCPCASYPVVEGIPILTPWARNRSFTVEQVLARHLPPVEGWAGRILRRLFPRTGRLRAALRRPDSTFLELAADLGRDRDLNYFRYRFSDLSYVGSAALLTPLVRGPILELGCGAGHLLHALARKLEGGLLVGLDINFTLLYLAKRFVEPTAMYICADACEPLPFPDGAFDAAFCSDTFKYFPAPRRAALELLRVVRGPLLISRLSDPGDPASAISPPPGPDEFLAMFSGRQPRLYHDRQILEFFLKARLLDLTRSQSSPGEVLTLTAGVEPRIYEGADYFVRGSQLNPIYEVQEEGSQLRLKRRFISEGYEEVYRSFDEFLPAELSVTREQIASGDPSLAERFVLLDLPPRYC